MTITNGPPRAQPMTRPAAFNPALHSNRLPPAVERALNVIGGYSGPRNAILDALRALERSRPNPYTWREAVRWPISRALIGDRSFRAETRTGLLFDLFLVSVIEKHVLLAPTKHPAYLWEPQTSKLLNRLAPSARNALVAGAYIGDLVLPIARAQPSDGVVHAFEPFAWAYEQFLHHCRLNAVTNVRAWPHGLWETSGIHLELSGEPALARLVASDEPRAASADTANTVSIDDYVTDNALPGLDFMALDLEGGEINALRGARQLLARPAESAPEIIFEINSAQTDWSRGLANTDVIQLLHGFGYEVYAIRDFNATLSLDGYPVEVVSIDTAILEGPPHGFNLFATKRPSRLSELDLRLCHNTSPKLILGRDNPHHQPINVPPGSRDGRMRLLA